MKIDKLIIKRILSAFAIAYAIYQAYHLAWICDDAYISFKYAQNLWLGNGLIFNPGERVEGYSNFLWTILLSSHSIFQIRMETLSIFLGILFYILTLLSFTNIYSMLAFSLFYHGAIFATSGLETSLFTFLITVGYRFYIEKKWNLFLSTYSLLILVRPDGALFFLGAILLIIYELYAKSINPNGEGNTIENVQDLGKNKNTKRNIFLLIHKVREMLLKPFKSSLIFATIVVLIYLGKAIYYGEMLPNTYWAKGSEGEYFKQGYLYLSYFFLEYRILSLFLIPCLLISQSRITWIILAYLFYVFYIGGDFMFARFIVPIIPISIQISVEQLKKIQITWIKFFPKVGFYFGSIMIVFFILSPLYRIDILAKDDFKIWKETGIGEEREFYKELGKSHLVYDSNLLKDLRVAFYGAQSHFIYYMNPLYALEANTGLTDFKLARTKVDSRGKIGHEKLASFDYLKEKRINIVMSNHYLELQEYPDLMLDWNGATLHWKILQIDIINFENLQKNKNVKIILKKATKDIWLKSSEI
jgi:hypothetical protein